MRDWRTHNIRNKYNRRNSSIETEVFFSFSFVMLRRNKHTHKYAHVGEMRGMKNERNDDDLSPVAKATEQNLKYHLFDYF